MLTAFTDSYALLIFFIDLIASLAQGNRLLSYPLAAEAFSRSACIDRLSEIHLLLESIRSLSLHLPLSAYAGNVLHPMRILL